MITGFDRRRLLHLSGLGLAATGLAPWIERAFARTTRAQALSEAWTRASRRGKPMLVLVVPLIRDRDERGTILAAYLQMAPEAAHADLAMCEMACAMVVELRALLPGIGRQFEGEPMAVLVEPDGKKARAVVERIPKIVEARRSLRGEPSPTPAEIDEQELWTDSIAAEFHAAIAGNRGALEHRAHQALERLSQADRERLVLLEASGKRPSAQLVALCPAWALFAATTEDARVECAAELSRLSRSSVVERAPRGARWAQYWGGCGGVRFEDPSEYSQPFPCGAGVLPARSRRFLWLYTKSDP